MSDNGRQLDESKLGAWMIAYDNALAGRTSPMPDAPLDVPELPEVKACLDILNARWPRIPRPNSWPTASEPPPEAASHVGRFCILRSLGRGGNGVVFLAFDPLLGREVALKVPRPDVLFDAEFRGRFLREAQAAAGLDHPNVVTVYEAGEAGPVCFIAVAYCPGGNLAEWLRYRDEPVPLRAAAELVAIVGRAVHYTHIRGVVHRDLKPSNILLEVQEIEDSPDRAAPEHAVDLGTCRLVPRVTDFGLARLREAVADLTHTGAVLGTPRYMAPEQAESRHEDVGSTTDTYALGCILYELLTGQPPFCGASNQDTIRLLLESEPVAVRRHRLDVPRDLETVCLKCLEKEPRRRYATAAALADDLHRWLKGEPVQARRVGGLGRAWRWCRRKPAISGMATLLALSLLGGLAVSLYQWRTAEAARREAEASEAQVQQLLNEILPSGPDAPQQMRYLQRVPTIDAMIKAETHFASLLEKRPGDTGLRIALTRLRGTLGTLYALRGQMAEMDASYDRARDLWETLAHDEPGKPEYRDWLATVYYWQSDAAERKGEVEQRLRLFLKAGALWQELAEEQPDNIAFFKNVAERRWDLLHLRYWGSGRDELLRPLREEKGLLVRLVEEDPDNTSIRKRLALIYLVLGEFHLGTRATAEALPCWRQSYDHYRKLADRQPNDPLVKLSLGVCCSRLLTEHSADPYYIEAVAQLGQAGKRLTALAQQHSDSEWLRPALLETYCSLAVCHWKAGQTPQAEQVFRAKVRPLAAPVNLHPVDLKQNFIAVHSLLRSADYLEFSKPSATLVIVREAAGLADRCADIPSRDQAFCDSLTMYSLIISAFLCRLGDPEEALRHAERARLLFAGFQRTAPSDPRYGNGLSMAWERIAKARWALGRRDEALAAFRESADVQRRVVEQARSVPAYKLRLSQCYNRLAHWGGLHGDRATVAAALLEREKLWPNDADELMKVSSDFKKLAESVGNGPTPLPPEAQLERKRYLAESERTRRAAEAARRKAPDRATR